MSTEQRFDVVEGINFPSRVLQWVTDEQVKAYCAKTDSVIVSDDAIGLILREVTVLPRRVAVLRGFA